MRLRQLPVKLRHLPHLVAGTVIAVLFFSTMAPVFWTSSANAALLDQRSVELSDSTVTGSSVSYYYSFNIHTSGPIGSMSFEVCSNYLFNQGDACTIPTGFNSSRAALNNSSGITDFTLQPPTTNSKLVITRPAATVESPQSVNYEFTGITNPTNLGSYYVHIATYASTDGSGPEVDYGNVVFSINDSINITTEVPPYLMFCVGITIDGFNCGTAQGGILDFGELSTRLTRSATSQMLASTNAPYGYSVTLAGTTMTAGNNVIPAMTGGPSQLGISQFGLNARANSIPVVGAEPDGGGITMPSALYNTPNQYRFVSGDTIMTNDHPDDYRKMTISYIVNRDANQAPGHYVATISYICLANF